MRAGVLSAFICLLVCVPCVLLAEADGRLVQSIENAIRTANPGWTCVHAIFNGPPPDVKSEKRLVTSVWEHVAQSGLHERVSMHISDVGSLDDAKLSLSPVRRGKVADGWTVKPYQIGDEGFLLRYRESVPYTIQFRKDTIIVKVTSDSIALAEAFSRSAEGEIPVK